MPDIGAYENPLAEPTHNSLIYVSTDGIDSVSFGFESEPFATIQAAIDYSIDGDTVLVSAVRILGYSITTLIPLTAVVSFKPTASSTITLTPKLSVGIFGTVYQIESVNTESSVISVHPDPASY